MISRFKWKAGTRVILLIPAMTHYGPYKYSVGQRGKIIDHYRCGRTVYLSVRFDDGSVCIDWAADRFRRLSTLEQLAECADVSVSHE